MRALHSLTHHRFLLRCLLTLGALAWAGGAAAQPAIQCHCFNQREYDPAQPTAADPYLLATTQNSFLAVLYDVPKKTIVRAKMTGTSGVDLWVAHAGAAALGSAADALLEARQAAPSWAAALAGTGATRDRLEALAAGGWSPEVEDGQLADRIVDAAVARHLGAASEQVAALRTAGADSQELILAALLARRLPQDPGEVRGAVARGRRTWGSWLAEAGLEAGAIPETLARLVR